MQGLIVHRDSYGKPRLWIAYRQKANFNVIEEIHNALDDNGVHPLIYLDALEELALSQIEPFETAEDLIKELKSYYKEIKEKKYGL